MDQYLGSYYHTHEILKQALTLKLCIIHINYVLYSVNITISNFTMATYVLTTESVAEEVAFNIDQAIKKTRVSFLILSNSENYIWANMLRLTFSFPRTGTTCAVKLDITLMFLFYTLKSWRRGMR